MKMAKKPFQSYINKEFYDLNKDINLFPDFSYKEPIPSSLAKSKDSRNNNLKKVHFRKDLNIELSITKSNDILGEDRITKKDTERFSKSDTGRISKNETDDEDILKKFQIDLYRKKRKKHFKLREQGFSLVKNQIRDEFSLYKLGKIAWAKEHASANRPMNKLGQFNKNTNFCNCCNLPCETPGVIEPFSFCENTENFSVCGKGVPLYFYFFRYCIYILIIVLFVMSIPIIISNNRNLRSIKKYCTYKKNNDSNYYNQNANLNKTCEKYIKGKNDTLVTNFLNWFWKVSSDNIMDYRNLIKDKLEYNHKPPPKNSTREKRENDKKVEKNSDKEFFINFSIIGFYCMLSIFIINIYFIILLKAKLNADKKDNILPSDYTLLITDLDTMVNEFKEKNDFSIDDSNNDIDIDNSNQDNLTRGISEYEYNNNNSLKTKTGKFTKFLIDTLFYNQKSKQSISIYNLNLCYKLNQFMVLKEKCEKCKYKIFQVENNPYQIEKNNNNFQDDKKRYYSSPFTYIGLKWLLCSDKGVPIDDLYSELEEYDNKLNLLVTKAKLKNFCGCIFATFNTVKDKREFYNKYPHFLIEFVLFYLKNFKYYLCCCFIDKKKKSKYFNRQRMRVYLAPDPEDVIWENMEFTFFQRFYRMIGIYSLTFILIGAAFLIVYSLNNVQETIKDEDWAEILKYTASFSISIVISLLNIFLEFIMKFFTKMEKQKSKTNYYLSYSVKLSIFTLTTSAFLPCLSSYLNRKFNGLEYNNNKNLINNMLVLFLVNSFVTPIIWIINFPLRIKRIRICLIERKKYPDLMHFKTQKELNDIYELPDMQIASKYSYIFKTVLMTMFYLPIFPFGVVISLSGLILSYFLEKYNFTHNYKRPEMLNSKLGKFYFNFFICILLSYCLGNYFFMEDIYIIDSWRVVNLLFFGILSIIPYTKPITYYFNKNNNFDLDSKPISDLYFSFYNDYQRQNPFTKKEGMYFYITELKNKGYVSKFIYDILLKNIEKINVMEIYYDTCKKPTLTQTQTALARINNKYNMEDLKNSIKRIFNEKEEKYEVMKGKNKRVKSDYTKNYACNKKSKFTSEEAENEESNKNYENKVCLTEIANNMKNDETEDNNNSINCGRKTERPKQTLQLNKIEADNERFSCSLTQAFTDRDSFILNQYKNPLLLNLGIGIQNLAFMDNNKKSFGLKKKTNSINRVVTYVEEEEEFEESEGNNTSDNLLEDSDEK